jgi:tetratricopeptide (TPR) repeat protein
VLGYAGLAKTLAFTAMYYGPPGDHLATALEVCDRAMRLDGTSPEVLAARGTVLSAMGETRRALADFSAALGARPDSPDTHYLLGRACLAEGDYRVAAAVQEHAARMRPDDFHSLILAAKARRRMGDEEGATADLARALPRIDLYLQARPNDFRALCDQACCLVELGRQDEAMAVYDALRGHHDPMAYYLVCVLGRSGQVDLAVDCLEDTIEAGWAHGPFLIHDPDLDGLRGERRFDRICDGLNAG